MSLGDGPATRLAKAQQVEAALRIIDPFFDQVIGTLMAELDLVVWNEPWAAEKITKLAFGKAIGERVRAAVKSAADGADVQDTLKWVQGIAEMSREKKRYADALGPTDFVG